MCAEPTTPPVSAPDRLAALRRYDVLDTPPEAAFDRVADVAAHVFDAPTALVTLIDADRQWFKACRGTSADAVGGEDRETGLDVSFCVHAVQAASPLVVEDATDDPRFADNPLVTGPPHIRFYAGAPLITPDGHALGTLCVLDVEPRTGDDAPSDAQMEQLEHLAAMVVDELELRRETAERERATRALERKHDLLQNVFETSAAAITILNPEGHIVHANARAQEVLGLEASEVEGHAYDDPAWQHTAVDGSPFPDEEQPFVRVMKTEAPVYNVQHAIAWPDGRRRILSVNGAPLRDETGTMQAALFIVNDITERTRAKQELAEREAQLRSINNHIAEGIYRAVPGEGLVYVNNAFADLFGYASPEAMKALDDLSVLYADPEERDAILKEVREHGLHGKEVRLQRADGSTFWGLLQTTAVYADDGTVKHLDGAVMDITERKEAEEELRRSRERWQRLVHAHRDPIQISIDGVIQYINPAGAELYGVSSPDAVIGREIFEFVSDATDDTYHERLAQLERGESTDPWEHEMVGLDGKRRIIRSYSVPIEYAGQRAAQTVLHDVTERREAEQALRESEARIRGLANSVPGVIFQFYAQPNADDDPGDDAPAAPLASWTYGFQVVSDQATSVLGLDADEHGFFDRFAAQVPNSHRDAFMDSVRDAIHHGADWSFEIPFDKPDGDTIWIQGLATPESRDVGHVWSGVLLDVTERKQLESQLRQAQKMETIGTLAGGIAHDFNNILHAAEAYLNMLESSLPADAPASTFLDRALTGLGRASGLVQKLLTFSRQEGKTVEKAVDVADVIEETLELTMPSLPSHVTLRSHVADDCHVLGDPSQLQQVVLNLITNAGQAMPGDDTAGDDAPVLDVEVRSTVVGEDLAAQHLNLEPGPYVRLTISDTGTGMSAETQERIFEPFFTTKPPGTGTGLGLPVVHGIVQAHDGEITVVSEQGEGTTFTVFLPALDDDAPEPPSPSDPETGHILLVDDDAQVLDLESMRLEHMGYTVTAVDRADDARAALNDAPEAFDLVLTDYAMPGLNGLDLIQALRNDGHDQPIVLMSGFSARVSADEVHAAGAQAYLRKPVGTRELRRALRHTLSDPERSPRAEDA